MVCICHYILQRFTYYYVRNITNIIVVIFSTIYTFRHSTPFNRRFLIPFAKLNGGTTSLNVKRCQYSVMLLLYTPAGLDLS